MSIFQARRGLPVLSIAVAALALGGAGTAQARTQDVCRTAQRPQAGDLLHVPFRIVGGRVYVQARVNGKGPFTFAIDTGASGMGRADASLARALQLPVSHTGESSDGVNSAAVDVTHLETLELGGFARGSLDVITRDYSSKAAPDAAISGIIGREFFADGLLIIDYPHRTVTFSRKRALLRTDRGALGYSRAFRVLVSIGAVQVEGNLDTGANVAFVLPKSLFDRVSDAALEQAGAGTLTNTRIATSHAVVHGPFRIGAASLADVDVRVSEQFPELLVGAKALENFAVLIDQRTRSVALCPAEATAR